MNPKIAFILLALTASAPVFSVVDDPLLGPTRNYDYEEEEPWKESAMSLPAPPRDENLVEFYVSATTTNRFFIDVPSVSVGPDRVVRYTLVVRSRGGATNVSYEGIRCDTKQKKVYAFGRADGSWSPLREPQWTDIGGSVMNRQHAALQSEYFCPGGAAIFNAAEGISALKRGGRR